MEQEQSHQQTNEQNHETTHEASSSSSAAAHSLPQPAKTLPEPDVAEATSSLSALEESSVLSSVSSPPSSSSLSSRSRRAPVPSKRHPSCHVCLHGESRGRLYFCIDCNQYYHYDCLSPKPARKPTTATITCSQCLMYGHGMNEQQVTTVGMEQEQQPQHTDTNKTQEEKREEEHGHRHATDQEDEDDEDDQVMVIKKQKANKPNKGSSTKHRRSSLPDPDTSSPASNTSSPLLLASSPSSKTPGQKPSRKLRVKNPDSVSTSEKDTENSSITKRRASISSSSPIGKSNSTPPHNTQEGKKQAASSSSSSTSPSTSKQGGQAASPSSSSTSTASSVAPSPKNATKSFDVSSPIASDSSIDPARQRFINMLSAALGDDSIATAYANSVMKWTITEKLPFKPVVRDIFARIVPSIKNNQALKDKIRAGAVEPQQLCNMTTEQLASEEMQRERARSNQEQLRSVIAPAAVLIAKQTKSGMEYISVAGEKLHQIDMFTDKMNSALDAASSITTASTVSSPAANTPNATQSPSSTSPRSPFDDGLGSHPSTPHSMDDRSSTSETDNGERRERRESRDSWGSSPFSESGYGATSRNSNINSTLNDEALESKYDDDADADADDSGEVVSMKAASTQSPKVSQSSVAHSTAVVVSDDSDVDNHVPLFKLKRKTSTGSMEEKARSPELKQTTNSMPKKRQKLTMARSTADNTEQRTPSTVKERQADVNDSSADPSQVEVEKRRAEEQSMAKAPAAAVTSPSVTSSPAVFSPADPHATSPSPVSPSRVPLPPSPLPATPASPPAVGSPLAPTQQQASLSTPSPQTPISPSEVSSFRLVNSSTSAALFVSELASFHTWDGSVINNATSIPFTARLFGVMGNSSNAAAKSALLSLPQEALKIGGREKVQKVKELITEGLHAAHNDMLVSALWCAALCRFRRISLLFFLNPAPASVSAFDEFCDKYMHDQRVGIVDLRTTDINNIKSGFYFRFGRVSIDADDRNALDLPFLLQSFSGVATALDLNQCKYYCIVMYHEPKHVPPVPVPHGVATTNKEDKRRKDRHRGVEQPSPRTTPATPTPAPLPVPPPVQLPSPSSVPPVASSPAFSPAGVPPIPYAMYPPYPYYPMAYPMPTPDGQAHGVTTPMMFFPQPTPFGSPTNPYAAQSFAHNPVSPTKLATPSHPSPLNAISGDAAASSHPSASPWPGPASTDRVLKLLSTIPPPAPPPASQPTSSLSSSSATSSSFQHNKPSDPRDRLIQGRERDREPEWQRGGSSTGYTQTLSERDRDRERERERERDREIARERERERDRDRDRERDRDYGSAPRPGQRDFMPREREIPRMVDRDRDRGRPLSPPPPPPPPPPPSLLNLHPPPSTAVSNQRRPVAVMDALDAWMETNAPPSEYINERAKVRDEMGAPRATTVYRDGDRERDRDRDRGRERDRERERITDRPREPARRPSLSGQPSQPSTSTAARPQTSGFIHPSRLAAGYRP